MNFRLALPSDAVTGSRPAGRAVTTYRPEIDGLRAIAVLSVVLFHAGANWFSGGYVGVDVFFVISGFLITRIIATGLDQQNFSFADFYRRRIRRLFPAYLVLIIAVVLAGYWLSLPKELVDLGQSLVAAAGFSTNILFWQESGYFAGASEIKPLLHTWSLSVEEQFYLFFPALLLLIAKYAKNRRALLIWAICLISLVLSEYLLAGYETATFYLLPTRAWELLLGSGLALLPSGSGPTRAVAEVTSVLGLVLIVVAACFMTPLTPFPGLNAAVPCIGAAAIIWAGTSNTIVNRLLANGAMTLIGKISYSLYLWHWPIFAYYRYYNIEKLSVDQVAIALALSFVLAGLSWRFVEQPFRRQDLTPRFKPFVAVILSSAMLVVIGAFFILSNGLRSRMSAEVNAMLAQSAPAPDRGCMAGMGAWRDVQKACIFPADDVHPSVALLGDSHAQALLPAFSEAAVQAGLGLEFYGYSACPPVLAIRRTGAGAASRCHEWNHAVLDEILSRPEIDTVVIAARHSVYLLGFTGDFGPAEGVGGVDIKLESEVPFRSDSDLMDGYFERLDSSVARFRDSGKRVILVLPVPEVGYDVPTTLALMLRKGADPSTFTRPYSMFQARQEEISFRLTQIARNRGAETVVPERSICDGVVCRVMDGGQPLYYDDDHLSVFGGRLLLPEIVAILRRAEA